MSKLLREFLQSYLDWVEEGAPQNAPYARGYGLCSNSSTFLMAEYDRGDGDLEVEMHDIFRAGGLWVSYPFGGCAQYDHEQETNSMHANPDRIAWIRAQLAK